MGIKFFIFRIMPKKGNKSNCGRGAVSTTHAPTMNNMQQVEKWTLYDLVPVFQRAGEAGAATILQIQAGTNGWNYTLT